MAKDSIFDEAVTRARAPLPSDHTKAPGLDPVAAEAVRAGATGGGASTSRPVRAVRATSGWAVSLGGAARSVTPLGRGVAGVGVVAWIVAARFGWEEFAAFAAACLIALAIGLVLLYLDRTRLRVLLELATPRVVVGNPASTRVETTNTATRRGLPVRMEARVGKGVAHVDVPALGAGESHAELFSIPTTRRSIVAVGPVRSVQGDPLGLVRRERTWTGTEHLYVHPKTVVVGSLTTGWMRDLEGHTTNDRSPSDVAFHTLREYVVGDDRRHIHWRTSARQTDGTLMVREFVDTRRVHLGLVLSVREDDYMDDAEFELAVSVLASLGLRGFTDEHDVTCLVGSRLVPSYHGSSFLDAMSGVELGADDATVARSVARGRDQLGRASVCAIVVGSGADEAGTRSATDRLGPGVRPVIVRVSRGATSRVAAAGSVPVIELGDLADLPVLVRSVAS